MNTDDDGQLQWPTQNREWFQEQAAQALGEDTIIRQVLDVANQVNARREINHPQYIEGTLYLTQQQWDALCAAAPPTELDPTSTSLAAFGIPVQVIHPDNPITLPSGKQLWMSGILGALLIVDPDVPWLPTRTPTEAMRDLLGPRSGEVIVPWSSRPPTVRQPESAGGQ